MFQCEHVPAPLISMLENHKASRPQHDRSEHLFRTDKPLSYGSGLNIEMRGAGFGVHLAGVQEAAAFSRCREHMCTDKHRRTLALADGRALNTPY